MNRPHLGAHVSVAGGLKNAIINAEAIGAECIQIHATSPRQWKVSMPAQEAVDEYFEARKKSAVKTVFNHAPYLINLASPDPIIHAKSIQCLVDNLKICNLIKAEGVIFHLGSSKDGNRADALTQQINAIKEAIKKAPGESLVILENSAGGGNKFGHTLEDIAAVIDGVGSDRVAVCFDTAHAFEAGVIEEYTKENVKTLWDAFDKIIGLKKLIALHVNDSKTAYMSNHDRHENLGHGFIGLAAFQNLAKEKRLNHTSWLLEVPGFDEMGPDLKNMEVLKKLFA